MKEFVSVLALVWSIQSMNAAELPVLKTSICDLVRNSAAYRGKDVQVRGLVARAEGLAIFTDCKGLPGGSIALRLPEEDDAADKSCQLIRDAAFERLEYYLDAEREAIPSPEPGAIVMARSYRYCKIRVTVVGRFDAVSKEDALLGKGFGNGGSLRFELVLHKVINPTAHECTTSH